MCQMFLKIDDSLLSSQLSLGYCVSDEMDCPLARVMMVLDRNCRPNENESLVGA